MPETIWGYFRIICPVTSCYWPGSELGYLCYHGNDMQNMWGNPAGVNPPENLALFISPLFIVVLWCIVLYSDCWSSASAQSQLSLVQFSVLWLINSPFLRQFPPLLWVRFVDQILVFACFCFLSNPASIMLNPNCIFPSQLLLVTPDSR